MIRFVRVSSRHISSIKEVINLNKLTLEDLRAVSTEVSGCLVNDNGFPLTLPNEIYGIYRGAFLASNFRAFLILQP